MSEHTHHHGILAGLSAGTAAVLTGGALIWASWSKISHPVAGAMLLLIWVFMVAVTAGLAVAVAFAFLWLRHRVLHPETLARRQVVTAEVLDSVPAAIPGPALALEPPRETHNHFHFPDADAAAAAVRAMRELER